MNSLPICQRCRQPGATVMPIVLGVCGLRAVLCLTCVNVWDEASLNLGYEKRAMELNRDREVAIKALSRLALRESWELAEDLKLAAENTERAMVEHRLTIRQAAREWITMYEADPDGSAQ